MYSEVRFGDFYDGFDSRRENFSYEGLQLLFDYFNDYEDSTGEKIEFDPIGICCEYNEYTVIDFNRENDTEFSTIEEIQEYIENDTFIVGITSIDTIVYVAY